MSFEPFLAILVALLAHPDDGVRNSAEEGLTVLNRYFGPLKCLKPGLQSRNRKVRKAAERILWNYVKNQGTPEIRYMERGQDLTESDLRHFERIKEWTNEGRAKAGLPPLHGRMLEVAATKWDIDYELPAPRNQRRVRAATSFLQKMYQNKFDTLKNDIVPDEEVPLLGPQRPEYFFDRFFTIPVALLGHPHYHVRISAQETLIIANGFLGPLPCLRAGFQSKDPEVRIRADAILWRYVRDQGIPEIQYLPYKKRPKGERASAIRMWTEGANHERRQTGKDPLTGKRLDRAATKHLLDYQRKRRHDPGAADRLLQEMQHLKFDTIKADIIHNSNL